MDEKSKKVLENYKDKKLSAEFGEEISDLRSQLSAMECTLNQLKSSGSSVSGRQSFYGTQSQMSQQGQQGQQAQQSQQTATQLMSQIQNFRQQAQQQQQQTQQQLQNSVKQAMDALNQVNQQIVSNEVFGKMNQIINQAQEQLNIMAMGEQQNKQNQGGSTSYMQTNMQKNMQSTMQSGSMQ
ncbi:putative nucleic acid-binding Zn-ribbon protein [Clostridium acetobutylicum]|uniref:Uncharacterized protein n=1 Tax=Clostridium acetobutylicum (strain ATCC 824 / DSM 792 / JCM 1419 / IAM 19013 / LMG 5710 / NBRC 13948 / NRRL B-527 / VKM B-1787 / 2291 / W) TaxID=272562 RepID=Q97GA9_CLOAB|nr:MULTISPECIES: hypothetical protein [Clostridium]AAK80414.1 Hypothetical protein CA_C2460 [Clostridium acetobutylicum ATCC 824]ADZ21511.1 Conserved hypothetical protein [Clostridium acetobutylicum EA 2018]AEI32356.1 hypothetical protein SMB_G2495 [Clostridium acetobutylicum DSM 1731]AWV79168.1 hypothetical protein DK921_03445 [Clostridium acetobutylicum]MBC2394868.1 hypothetical protein [Clostridium acetobutylicum]